MILWIAPIVPCDASSIWPPGGRVYLTKFYTGRLRPEVQPLTLSFTILAEKVPLLYTLYWKKVPLSHTYFRKFCSGFHVVLNKWTSFEIASPFLCIFINAISSEKRGLISVPFLTCQLDVRTLAFFPPAECWLVNSNFPRASRMQGVALWHFFRQNGRFGIWMSGNLLCFLWWSLITSTSEVFVWAC